MEFSLQGVRIRPGDSEHCVVTLEHADFMRQSLSQNTRTMGLTDLMNL